MNDKYDNTNRGALFRNDKKEKPTQPDYTGSLDIDGVEHWLSGWIEKSKAGATYLSLSAKKKTDTPAVLARPAASKPAIDPDSDIPF